MKKTVLFVDDEEINLFVLSKRFGEEFHVLTTHSSIEALRLIREGKEKIEALVTDVKMPEMSGLQLIEKAGEALQGVPCFLLTGYDQHVEINDALLSGKVAKLFKKPFNYNEISDTLKSYLY